ncbi:MAG: hypothetical protein MJ252_07250 [archaeon]|nr:hypothetical protein [archaeon]
MYSTLIKKVNISKGEKLNCIDSNKSTNFMAIGGSNGFVQVVNMELEKPKDDDKSKVPLAQALEYHSKTVTIVAWNELFNKLTTCDSTGLMVVWKNQNDKWDTEMINNREVSYITDIKWSKQGQFLCFIYADGHAIVGTVEGNRSWGNDIRNSLYKIEWSPDGSILLLAAEASNIIILSSSGQQLGELELISDLKEVKISSINWWTNVFSENRSATLEKHLLIAFQNGKICLYDNENDLEPFMFTSNMNPLLKADWHVSGNFLACCGQLKGEKHGVSFYSTKGELIRVVKTPEPILGFCFDDKGSKIALETQTFIYIGLIKQNLKWCYFSDTLVYSYLSEQEHHTLVFWNTKTKKQNLKYVKKMVDLVSFGSFCLISAKINEDNYLLILSNSIGSPVDNKIINIEPVIMCMNSTHCAITDKHYVYIWQFRGNEQGVENKSITFQGKEFAVNLLTKKMMRELCFFIDNNPNLNDVYNYETFQHKNKSEDPIVAMCMNETYLVITCFSGKTLKFDLLSLTMMERYNMDKKVTKIGLSPSAKYLWVIDEKNFLNIWDLEGTEVGTKRKGEKLNFEKKEVWDVKWSDQDELTYAFMEKNKLNIMKNSEPEEVLQFNGYLADFSDLNITLVKLEDLLAKPFENNFEVDDIVQRIETRVLRDLRELTKQKVPIEDLYNYVNENSNRKLWELLAKHTMFNLDFNTAEKALIHMNDYMGLVFLQRIKTIDDNNIKKAEIAQFFEDYDQAEAIYNESDRKDLSIAMRLKLGQWDRVINLMKDSGVVQEDNLKLSYSNYADSYFLKKEYDKAEELYKMADNTEGLINVWFETEEFEKVTNFIEKFPEKSEFLAKMGEKFENYGLCEEAVNCYIRYGDPKRAIDTCVLMNKWNLAVELAEKNNFFQIEGLINKFGNILIEKNKKMDLVELYRKAHRHTEAAKILIKIAEDLKVLNASPMTLKKIYVIAALEMESFKTRLIDAQITNITTQQQPTGQQSTTLDTLITSDLSNTTDKTLNNPWKGAEAYHFYMLCQSQLYQNKVKDALKTALRLVVYEKEIGAKEVYRLIALSAFLNNCFKECSKALSKLENMGSLSKAQRECYRKLALNIFIQNDPINQEEQKYHCPAKGCDGVVSEYDIDCAKCGSIFSPCIISGQSILSHDYIKCKRCKHKAIKGQIYEVMVKYCPLCHAQINLE